MTMEGVYGLADKDTGDVRGDMSFVLNKKESGREAESSPLNPYARVGAKFSGDAENSTDLILEMQVEVDG